MTIQYAVPIPEKPHVLHVGLLVPSSVERVDPVTKVVTMVDGINEVPVRKVHFASLGPLTAPFSAKQLTYVKRCCEYHHPTDRAKRDARKAAWEADDKAVADAAAEAARQAELAKFTVTPQGFVKDKEGEVIGVQATITHQGHTCTANIGLVAELAEQNARTAWQASKDAADKVQAALNAFAVSV